MDGEQKIPVVVIFAPTACGKTALAREIFGSGSLFGFKGMGEVVSADSQAVYRHLDIGTAKPSLEERTELPHHLVDIVSPDRQFGVGDFLELADSSCREIHSRGKIPIVLGGTGFYIRSFILGLPPTPISDPEQREKIKKRLELEGNSALFHELKKVDPVYAKKNQPARWIQNLPRTGSLLCHREKSFVVRASRKTKTRIYVLHNNTHPRQGRAFRKD